MIALRDFLKLNHGNHITVCVKEPDKCAKYWTTFYNGIPNTSFNGDDFNRNVYSVGLAYEPQFKRDILSVTIW